MSAQPAPRHLHLVDENGEVVPSVKLDELNAEIEKLHGDLKAAERDLRAKRRRITELEADKARERLEHPQRALIRGICKYWHQVCRPDDFNGPRRIQPDAANRFDAVAALVEMERIVVEEIDGKRKRRREWVYQREHFAAAVQGAAFDAFVVTHKNGKKEPQNDLAQICKDVTRFERAVLKCPYEVVPLSPARPSPLDVARGPAKWEDPHRVPTPGVEPDSGTAIGGGPYGPHTVGAALGRASLPVEGFGLRVRGGVVVGHPGASAA